MDVSIDLFMLEAATAEVYNFDSTLRGVSQQDILRLEITVHYAMMPHQAQRQDHLTREASYQSSREPNKPVRLDQFVQVDTEQLHRNAEMIAEVEVFGHFNDMMLLFMVPFTKIV